VTEHNREIVKRMYAVADSGDLDQLSELVAEDYTLTQAPGHPVPGYWQGKAAADAGSRVFRTLNVTGVTVQEIVADGPHRVIGLVQSHGTDTNGQPWTMPVAECFWIENGKVTDIRPFYWDLIELRRIAGIQ
jgi:ketosteroid isomerase-like protein